MTFGRAAVIIILTFTLAIACAGVNGYAIGLSDCISDEVELGDERLAGGAAPRDRGWRNPVEDLVQTSPLGVVLVTGAESVDPSMGGLSIPAIAPSTSSSSSLASPTRPSLSTLALLAVDAALIALLLKLAPTVLPIIGGWIGMLIRKKVKNDTLKTALEIARKAVMSAVLAVQQVYLDELEKALKDDGKISPAELKEAKRRAMLAARAQIPPEVLMVLELAFPDGKLDEWLGTEIEAAVQTRKLGLPVASKIIRSFGPVPGLERGS